MRFSKLILISAAAFTLSACATSQPAMQAGSTHFGDAVRHNMSAQAVAPTDKQKADTFIPPNSKRRRLAIDTYEAGETEDPRELMTTGGDE
ncbi:hypothetical protein ACJ3XI_11960 [Litorimonas sp. RW-G-Af-16]|uniref:hypothetical protein n=1 Tax=Litorimonas sp. RW-G-Af-16 TaxID=3241168 RepID=UPI00390CA7B6